MLTIVGGLSISVTALRANIHLSVLVALTGISAPIALSFVLTKMLEITSLQAFAAGAALCSTSLGTTFTILSTSGLSESRLGTILSSAAMLDDVVGLIMVQVISNLGTSASSFSAITVVRPVFVSLAFAVIVPLVCCFVVRPIAIKIRSRNRMAARDSTSTARWLLSPKTALLVHTLVLAGFVAGSSYAGTSNLFAAYLAGACIGWFDSLDVKVEQRLGKSSKTSNGVPLQTVGDPLPASNQVLALDASSKPSADSVQNGPALSSGLQPSTCDVHNGEKANSPELTSGMAIYETYYAPAVQSILKPFFFVCPAVLTDCVTPTNPSLGINRLLHPHNADVCRPHSLAWHRLHNPDAPRKTHLRSLAYPVRQSPKHLSPISSHTTQIHPR